MTSHLYVSVKGDDALARFAIDPASGVLTLRERIPVRGGPAPLAVDPSVRRLYVGLRREPGVASFTVDPDSGALEPRGHVPLDAEPCFIATDRSGRYLLSAYYQAGKVAVHPIDEDGVVFGPPVESHRTGFGAHACQTDPTNRFAFVPHIAGRGSNVILQYRFDSASGRLTPNRPAALAPDGPLGPRHFCFHPDGKTLYFSNEQGSSVSTYALDTSAGTLHPVQTLSTLPEGFRGSNTCSQIRITPAGTFVFVSNRGHDSIAVLAVAASGGRLTLAAIVPTAPIPRAFGIDPTGRYLYAAGLSSGRLIGYRVEPASGALTPVDEHRVGATPMWVLAIAEPHA